MPNRLKPLNLVDFTGGINLRPETFQLAENELPELLNLEVDPRGGLNCRHGWKTLAVNPAVPGTKLWNGRNAYLHVKADGTRIMLVCNRDSRDAAGGEIYAKITPAVTWAAIVSPSCTAVPHGADFAAWDDDAFITRGGQPTVTYNGTAVTTLAASGAANWQNDYTAPGATATAPIASLIAQHQGYLFVAGTREDAVNYPNRIRWSHPNNPRRWAQTDYIDISEGGQGITGIIPFSDRLLIFKPDSVWALFGYDANTWAVNNISRTIGAHNQQLIVRNESSVFFLSWPHGIFAYEEKANVVELSIQIRRVFEDQTIDPTAMANAWMGWVGRRLWVSLPYYLPNRAGLTNPPDAKTAFVFDPITNSWTSFVGAGNNVPGPYLERVEVLDDEVQVAFTRQYSYSVRLDGRDDAALDEFVPGTTAPFPTAVRTKWLDGGAPTWKKSWRRPDLLLRGLTIESTVNAQVFHNFDSYNAQRSFVVGYTPDHTPALFTADGGVTTAGGFKWGDGTPYGGTQQSTSVERGGTMGRAGAVQVRVTGLDGVTWGLNGIVFKYIPRRFR